MPATANGGPWGPLIHFRRRISGTDPAGLWLANPAYGLGGKIPVLHAGTRKGKAEVVALMNRIEYGVLC